MSDKVAVIGLGYVGLPLALLAEEKDFNVVGLDLSKNKLKLLQNKKSPIDDIDAEKRLKKSKIIFTDNYKHLKDRNIAVICVPTPVNDNKLPDLSIVKSAAVSCASNLRNDSLLVIESTINPGVCDEVIIPAIESETNHKVGKTLHIAHCPERINPGDPKWHVGNIPRVIGADSDSSLELAHNFYKKLINAKIKKMGSLKEAEAVKIVENSFRDINIAFVNELAMSFEKLGIDVVNVIDGAATKPFAFMPHYPGIGVGGHCIPVDPYYLIEYARGKGFDHDFLKLARTINEGMPVYAVDKLELRLIELGLGDLKNKSIAILGLSYKPNVGDDRESPGYKVVNSLTQRGAKLKIYDPYFLSKSTCMSIEETLLDVDAIVLTVAHEEFKQIDMTLLSGAAVFLDGRNVYTKKFFDKIKTEYIGMGIV